MSWIGGLALFVIGAVTGFLMCGFLIVVVEDRREEDEHEQRGVRRQ